MRIIIVTVVLLVSTIIFSSCDTSTKTTVGNYKKELSEEVIRCLDDNDEEGLKKLFCKATLSNTSTLDKQISLAMEFYEGKCISHGIILGTEGSSIRGGDVSKEDINPHICEIKTDQDKTYDIWICSYKTNTEYPEKVGISEIHIKSEDGSECTIGEYIY